MVRSRTSLATIWLAAWAIASAATPAHAIFWNNDPAFGVASSPGLTDRTQWFQNVYQINNQTNNTFGTTTLLNNEWAITVRHVVQNGGDYGAVAPADRVYVNVGGRRYYADEIFTPDGNSEMALIRLRGGVPGALDATATLNSDTSESGRVVHIGGYGYRGHIGTTGAGGSQSGSVHGLGSFRRAYNVATIPSNQIRIVADGESTLENFGLLEGTVGSGDSGGPMFGFFGSLRNGLDDPADWRLIGLTATGSGGSGGESWGGQSNYTRVSSYAGFLQSTLATADPAGPSTTAAWAVDSGDGFWDSAGDRLSFTGSADAPIAHAPFGPDGLGHTLDSVGDALTMTARLDTDQPLRQLQLRYGMFDDAEGTIGGVIEGGDAWNGYFAGNAIATRDEGVFEKGQSGGGVGAWWGRTGADTAVEVPDSATLATGSYLDAGFNYAPAGLYDLSLTYTRAAEGLQIDWSMLQVDDQGDPTGVYEHSGSAVDSTPASPTWNYNQLGLHLLTTGFEGSIVVDDVAVAFVAGGLPGDFNADGAVDAADFTVWRDGLGAQYTAADYTLWRDHYGETAAPPTPASTVPEPAAALTTLLAAGLIASRRTRR
ncbi:trypsin-like serine protease [Pseudobythopirellula maris]|nr:trypsin-like serine protease [Pseudobythopirellula maris]